MRFNDKPFRGKLEVFANPRGALTVVNVIGLEDYVRGVVPNELSPGGFPAIEALKAQVAAIDDRRIPLAPNTALVVFRGSGADLIAEQGGLEALVVTVKA